MRDPLLSAARIMLTLCMGVTVLAGAACAAALPAVAFMSDGIRHRFIAEGAPPDAVWGLVAVLVLAVACAVLGFYFFRSLRRIVGTVAQGDPFVAANAVRLQQMGWISVAAQALLFPLDGIGEWLKHVTHRIDVNVDFPFTGVLLSIILFILARVFRQGARMRDDLEGTV